MMFFNIIRLLFEGVNMEKSEILASFNMHV